MKKIFVILGIGIIWCFLPMLVYASSPVDYATYSDGIRNFYNDQNITVNQTGYNNLCADYVNHTNWKLVIGKQGTYYFTYLGAGNSKGENNIYVSGSNYINRLDQQSTSALNQNLTFSLDEAIYFENYDAFCAFQIGPVIDWDSVYYSPLIATPILNPYYTSYNEAGINIPYVPLTFDLSNPNENYYLQIKQKNYTPSVVRVDGANKFNVQARNGFDVHDVYEMQDLIVSSDFSRNDFYNDISDNWTDDLNEFAFSNVEMINGLHSTIGSTADAYFLAQSSKFQQFRNIQTVYGNIIEIWARYFMLDENNNVVVGKWYHWWSLASDSFDEQLPEYVVPYEKAYGTENTTDNNNAPNGVGTTNGTGTSSNPNQNYTYVSVVPNYPDYPTIASYNKDNLLVDTITKMLEVKSFFGEFNDFLTVSFVWVPDWIWGLIGIGFGLSILVFFLRML